MPRFTTLRSSLLNSTRRSIIRLLYWPVHGLLALAAAPRVFTVIQVPVAEELLSTAPRATGNANAKGAK